MLKGVMQENEWNMQDARGRNVHGAGEEMIGPFPVCCVYMMIVFAKAEMRVWSGSAYVMPSGRDSALIRLAV